MLIKFLNLEMLGQSQEQIESHDPNAPRLHIFGLFDLYLIDMASD